MSRSANPSVEAVWRRRLQNQPQSGLTIGEFCRQEGISTSNFFAWKRRLAKAEALPILAEPRNSAFVPVTIHTDVIPIRHPSIEPVTIHLGNRARIHLPVDAGAELICRVVETVARTGDFMEDSSC